MASVNETWKEINGFDGKYSVSDTGKVRNNQLNRIFKTYNNRSGYPTAKFRIEKSVLVFRVHRLVAEAFIENTHSKDTVNHKNGIKTDNRVSNLEWATRSEQQLHAYSVLGKIGAMTGRPSHLNSNAKKIIAKFSDGTIKIYGSLKDFSTENNVIYTNASRVLRGKQRHINNIKLEYDALGK